MFRPLKADEIQVKVNRIGESWADFLLYKNARVDMQLLDEIVGPMNWKRKQIPIPLENGDMGMICSVAIYNEKSGEWIEKQDVGEETSSSKEKGQASDSFKRACTNWGIGRELYNAPEIIIFNNAADEKIKISQKNDGKFVTYDHFSVRDLVYDYDKDENDMIIQGSGRIIALQIRNDTSNKIIFTFDVRTEDKKLKMEQDKAKKRASYKKPAAPVSGVANPVFTTAKSNTTVESNTTAESNTNVESNTTVKSNTTTETTSQAKAEVQKPEMPVKEAAATNSPLNPMIADVGSASFKGKSLDILTASQLFYVFQYSQSDEVKTNCKLVAAKDANKKKQFIKNKIPV